MVTAFLLSRDGNFSPEISLVTCQNQNYPLQSFCRRFGHATALIDQRLFIDGGLINLNPLDQNPLNHTNLQLLYHDLRVDNRGMPQLYASLAKNLTVPAVSGGVLWEDTVNKVFIQFGGEYEYHPQPFSSLFLFDTLLNVGLELLDYALQIPILNQWSQISVPNNYQRVAWGAGLSVDSRAEGYYLGGWMSDRTTPGWSGIPLATSKLIRYDMIGNTFSNNTGPDTIGRAEGAMVHIPASEAGLLIYFGGILDPYRNGTVIPSPMSVIYIYDIMSSKWYNQTASGDVPQARRRFCAGVTWANDHSSYNIYLYGGLGIAPNETAFDDVYILSLPSFRWIKWWPTEEGPGSPHHSMTCNVIDRSQMLIIGGTFPNQQDLCDNPLQYGTHNLNLGKTGPDGGKWDLFYPNITTYQVPSEIIAEIGGGPTGGATALKPQNDWTHRDLSVYFSEVTKPTSRTPTRFVPSATGNPGSSPSFTGTQRTGTIVGSVIAGFVLLISASLAGFCLRSQRRARRQSHTQLKPAGQLAERRAKLPATSIAPAMLPGSEQHFLTPASLNSSNLTSSPGTIHEAFSSPARPNVSYFPIGPYNPNHRIELDASSPLYSTQKDHPSIAPEEVNRTIDLPILIATSTKERTPPATYSDNCEEKKKLEEGGSILRTPDHLYFKPLNIQDRDSSKKG